FRRVLFRSSEGWPRVASAAVARHPGRLPPLSWSLAIMMMCGSVSLPAAQEVSTNATVTADTGAETVASDALGQAGAPPTPQHTGIKAMIKGLGQDVTNLPSRQNLIWVGVGAGLSLAVHPLDKHANNDLSGNTLGEVFTPGAVMGQSYTLLGVAGAVYAFGRIEGEPKVSHMGMDLLRSLLI